ncbi:MAG: LPS export ABC transporter ATP-binding protein, partial [Candidatus Raymondbacteria bacterium RifOxyB12_full_50_8]
MNQIRTDRIVRVYSGRKVVNEVSITVNKGEVVGLLGPNGAGKTTSFYMIVGLIKPTKGRIFGDDRDITSLPMYRRARVGIGYLPQEASVFRKLSVEDNIMAILESLKIPDHDRRERLEQLLEDFNITAVRKSLAYTLSGGERRRTEIARSLATTPDFMLLDEPFAGIDPIAVEDIQSIISGLRQKGLGVLITDHNVRDTLAITDRAYIICEGQILK